eukprot:jgi/Botrbrau1/9150/Bobra.160_3s0022.1
MAAVCEGFMGIRQVARGVRPPSERTLKGAVHVGQAVMPSAGYNHGAAAERFQEAVKSPANSGSSIAPDKATPGTVPDKATLGTVPDKATPGTAPDRASPGIAPDEAPTKIGEDNTSNGSTGSLKSRRERSAAPHVNGGTASFGRLVPQALEGRREEGKEGAKERVEGANEGLVESQGLGIQHPSLEVGRVHFPKGTLRDCEDPGGSRPWVSGRLASECGDASGTAPVLPDEAVVPQSSGLSWHAGSSTAPESSTPPGLPRIITWGAEGPDEATPRPSSSSHSRRYSRLPGSSMLDSVRLFLTYFGEQARGKVSEPFRRRVPAFDSDGPKGRPSWRRAFWSPDRSPWVPRVRSLSPPSPSGRHTEGTPRSAPRPGGTPRALWGWFERAASNAANLKGHHRRNSSPKLQKTPRRILPGSKGCRSADDAGQQLQLGGDASRGGSLERGMAKLFQRRAASEAAALPQEQSAAGTRITTRLNNDHVDGSTLLNQYLVVRELGHGAQGKVKLCLSSHDFQLYAVKFVARGKAGREALQWARAGGTGVPVPTGSIRPTCAPVSPCSEAEVMRRLSHPNIVRLVEVIDDPEAVDVLLVMEFVEGAPSSLRMRLSSTGSCPSLWPAVQYLHSQGVYHADLKPQNMLLAGNCSVKLIDFGSSQRVAAGTRLTSTKGTPAFMSPEVVSGLPYLPFPADLWALGISLFMFLYGHAPFKGDSIMQLYDDIRAVPPRTPERPVVSAQVKDLLAGLLDKRPESRLTITGLLTHPALVGGSLRSIPSVADCEVGRAGSRGTKEGTKLPALVKLLSQQFEARSHVQTLILTMATSQTAAGRTRRARGGVLKRSTTAISRILRASLRASQLMNSLPPGEADAEKVAQVRGPGEFIGELSLKDFAGPSECWKTSVRALAPVRALLLNRRGLHQLMDSLPEAEPHLRVAMAKRKWELVQTKAMERLAGLRDHLDKHSDPAQLKSALEAMLVVPHPFSQALEVARSCTM